MTCHPDGRPTRRRFPRHATGRRLRAPYLRGRGQHKGRVKLPLRLYRFTQVPRTAAKNAARLTKVNRQSGSPPQVCLAGEGEMDFKHYKMGNRPTLMNALEAWWLVGGQWRMLDPADAFMNAIFIGEPVFRRRFKILPPLPVGAFSARVRLH